MRFTIIDCNDGEWILNFLDTDGAQGTLTHNGNYKGLFTELEAKQYVEAFTGGPIQSMSRTN